MAVTPLPPPTQAVVPDSAAAAAAAAGLLPTSGQNPLPSQATDPAHAHLPPPVAAALNALKGMSDQDRKKVTVTWPLSRIEALLKRSAGKVTEAAEACKAQAITENEAAWAAWKATERFHDEIGEERIMWQNEREGPERWKGAYEWRVRELEEEVRELKEKLRGGGAQGPMGRERMSYDDDE
ncbi:hypothetical protein CC78DRAFT_543659 [Lojkania enalia]|uniref:Uncharacterized protein n=1 Tax=Lojkania enalia TaxID=147567 RepID=A0A9P4KCA5_9PLEO|nr:hypothetical protein CC78DRAFT_543659 [Didymosphaeria enalia]